MGNIKWSSYLGIAYVSSAAELTIFTGALGGACLGFLWFNCHPAQVIMGDVGALSLGGTLGLVAILIKQEFLLFFIAGVFILEALSVILQISYFRMTGGKRLFKMAPPSSPLRAHGLARRKGRHPFLDSGHHLRSVQLGDIEIEINMELRNKRVLVVGFGRTGESLCRFLIRRNASVRVSDRKFPGRTRRQGRPARGAGASRSKPAIPSNPSSPPISSSSRPASPRFKKRKPPGRKGIPVISEIELAYRFLKGRIVAVTGSNGKSTTTTLAQKILSEAGLRAFAAGNIGVPLISFADGSREDDIYVTEISSFQLEHIARLQGRDRRVPQHL